MRILFLLILTYATLTMNAQSTADIPEIIYVGDPMCSWCYGFSGELEAFAKRHEGAIDMTTIVGGLRPGGGDAWDDKFRDFLRHHWEEVAERSGQPFSYDLLDWPAFDYDTEPACRAVVIAQTLGVQDDLGFFRDVQVGFYLENRDPKEVAFYRSLCEKHGLDFKEFAALFESGEARIETASHFTRARALGANSFPTVFIRHDGKLEVLARGYSTADDMTAQLQQFLAQD